MTDKEKKLALQTAKEIVVKFIEVGRVSPSNFGELFPAIYAEVLKAVKDEPAVAKPADKPEAARAEAVRAEAADKA